MYCKECSTKEEINIFSYGLPVRSINISLIKILLFEILKVGIGFIITIPMFYGLIGSLLKKKVDFKVITSIVGICFLVITIPLIFSFLALFFSIKFAYIFVCVTVFVVVYRKKQSFLK